MFRCEDCGEVFDYPHTYKECIGEYWGVPAYEEFAECPCCGSSEFIDLDEVEEEDEDADSETDEVL